MLEKYLELSEICQRTESENRELTDALIKLGDEINALDLVLKEKTQMIGDLIIEKTRLKDMLILKTKELEQCQAGYKIPEPEQPVKPAGFIDRMFKRGVPDESNNPE